MPNTLPARGKVYKPTPKMYDLCNFGVYRHSTMEGLPDDEASTKIKNYVKNIDRFLSDRVGLYLHGGDQVGKAWRAAAIANYMLTRGYSVQMISAGDLGNLWFRDKDLWDADNGITMIERLRSVHCLVITGLGKEYSSDFHVSRLASFLNSRKNEPNSVTIITSQYAPARDNGNHNSPLYKAYGSEVAAMVDALTIPVLLTGESFAKMTKRDLSLLL